MWILLSVLLLPCVAIVIFMNHPSFGKAPRGERKARMEQTDNFRDGKFHNTTPSFIMASNKPKLKNIWEFLWRDIPNLRPEHNIPVISTNLRELNLVDDVVVWLGHSTIYMQLAGKRMLIDPALVLASPVSFANKPFKGADYFKPNDIPDLDYIIVSHDHWDHLDYQTVKALQKRTKKIICPLGVGEHFEHWGFEKDSIIELYWNESALLDNGITIHCLPARHFSGRSLNRNNTLWASYMIQSPSMNVYMSGDTGYDQHFKNIGEKFEHIDFAIMENGQYNKDWKDIHLMPADLLQAIKDLHPVRFMTVHNSKYALSKHAWYEPLENIAAAAEKDSLNLVTPLIGQPVRLKNDTLQYKRWWK